MDGFSRLVLEEYGPQLPPEAGHYLQNVCRGAQQMGTLIDDLSAFSQLSRRALRRQSVSMADLVRQTVEDLRSQREGRHIEIRQGDLPPCEGDPALLKQVWINLLANAQKYTRQRANAVIEIGCTLHENGTIYFVRDNGAGFDMQYAGKLFGVFQRLHRAEDFEGTGVGLAIVQRIIQRHGGRIWAEAAVDRGATFYFTLPRRGDIMNERHRRRASAGRGQPPRSGTDPACVEEGPPEQSYRGCPGRSRGISISSFATGPHVGRAIEDTPKVILLDLKLPKVDGLEVL